MEELRAGDLRLLGPYVLLAALTPAGGEPRLLARRSAEEGLAEITLLRGERVRASAAALHAAAGPGFPELLEDGSTARPPWLAWRFVPALTLAEAGALMYGGLPHATVRALAARLAAPLARLHAQGTTHGALTADAVLLTPDGPRLVRPRRTGTPQADIYALGTVLTHAGAGRAPDDPLLRRCSHEAPQERPTAEELAEEFKAEPFELPARLVGALAREADRALALESATDAPPPVPAARATRRTLLTAAGAGLLLGAGGVAGWVAGRGGTEALTSPAASTRRTTPGAAAAVRGTTPAALWRYDTLDPRLTERNPSLAHSSGRVHFVDYPKLTALRLSDGRPAWGTAGLGPQDRLEPAEPGTLILFREDRFQAVSAEDGAQLWTEPIDLRGLDFGRFFGYERKHGLMHYSAAGSEGAVPGAAGRTYLISFDVRRRTEAWRLPVPAETAGEFLPVFDEKDALHVLYGADGALNLVEVDRSTGRAGRPFRHTWRPANRKVGVSSVSQQVYTFGEGRIEAAPLRENKPLWRLDLSSDPVSGEPPALNTPSVAKVPGLGTVLFTSDTTRTVYAIDPARGRELWRRTLLPDPPSSGILDGPIAPGLSMPTSARTLLAYGRGAGVVALNPRTGAVKWTFQSNQTANSLYHAYIVDDRDLALIANGPSLFAFPVG